MVVWGAWPFHRAAWANLRHGAATMDTLISVGVAAALLWSVWALFFTHAGMTGMKMSSTCSPSGAGPHIYLEVAAAVTTFILAGRYFEARAKRSAGRRCGRCSTWAPRTSPCCATVGGATCPDRPARRR